MIFQIKIKDHNLQILIKITKIKHAKISIVI